MHEDLSAVVRLWDNVRRADELAAERATCTQRRVRAGEAIGTARQALAEARAALDETKASERQVMRKLDSYRQRIETTRRMIETGTAPDYRLAETQLRSCTEVADGLETEALELMERRDQAEARAASAEAALAEAEQQHARAEARAQERLPAIAEELAALTATRPGLEALVPGPLLGAFAGLRTRGRSVVSPLKDGACSICNYGAPSQVLIEIQGDQRVHQCRNCQRFLLPEGPV